MKKALDLEHADSHNDLNEPPIGANNAEYYDDDGKDPDKDRDAEYYEN